MPAITTSTREDAQIRARMDAWAQALRAKDIDALMAHYARDIVTFDLMPLQCEGLGAYRKNFEAWFASVQGPIAYEMRELHLTTGDALAFGHHLARVRTTRTSGTKNDYWVRVTVGLRKTGDQWMITHEHVSVPFSNAEGMQAALAAQP